LNLGPPALEASILPLGEEAVICV